ncbi:hypothetical protein C5167_040100 [Papaver somniferum]|uniref:peptidylprolyl isomerase n=1 Tax=Papaver somniferum TaxID=3469 RepID=A0A4Y7IHG0_PAPSO|nr:hypothetical protein C5167_040100 [Papaver somniferum]
MVQCSAFVLPTSSSSLVTHQLDESTYPKATSSSSLNLTRRLLLSNSITCATSISLFSFPFIVSSSSPSKAASITEFVELEDSGGVKSLDLRTGDGAIPMVGDQVISGITAAIKTMKVGGIRRVIIPPSQGYQNTSQEPLPPKFFDRQRLFTTIFNPTRLANGEGSTLGILIFDIELLSVRHN